MSGTVKRRESLTSVAYKKIKQMILNGTFRQGELISINGLSETLSISRTPISNACQRLELEKFLTISPKQGVVVNTISLDAAREIYELRAAIESYNAKRAYSFITGEDIAALQTFIESQAAAAAQGDSQAFMESDTRFHRLILEKNFNSEFLTIIDTLYDRAFLLGMHNNSPQRLQSSIQEHQAIVGAILSHDRQGFADTLEQHILNGYRSLTSAAF